MPDLVLIPEFEFVLDCCAEMSNSERGQRIRRIVSDRFDWDKMLRLAEHHRLVPRVYEQLSALDVAPPQFLETLRTRYQASARQALWFTGELIRIVDHLESHAIQVLPYKGPTLAEALYADVTKRQFGDLDFLVRASDVAKGKTALLDLGYESNLHFTEREAQAYLASGYEYTFNSTHGRNLVELKWQILPRFYSVNFDVDAIFQKAVSGNIGGHSLRTLCAEDLLLVLCVHAAKHAWSQLSWLCDITQLANQALDWEAIEKQSNKLGIQRLVAVNFILAHKLLGTPLPEMVEKNLRTDHTIDVLAGEIVPIVQASAGYNTESVLYFRLMIKLRERWQDRIRFLWRLAFTPTTGEWSAIRLPSSLFPLYRLVRIFRLIGKLLEAT
jgi:Uncharacterised nucleotidyltransferase